jgi:hypothetical protein
VVVTVGVVTVGMAVVTMWRECNVIDDGEGGLGAYHIGMPVTHCDIVCFV